MTCVYVDARRFLVLLLGRGVIVCICGCARRFLVDGCCLVAVMGRAGVICGDVCICGCARRFLVLLWVELMAAALWQ